MTTTSSEPISIPSSSAFVETTARMPASRRLRSPHAADPIELVMLDDGAILSYRKSDGRYVHTLNTFEGLARKLAQLEAVDDVASP